MGVDDLIFRKDLPQPGVMFTNRLHNRFSPHYFETISIESLLFSGQDRQNQFCWMNRTMMNGMDGFFQPGIMQQTSAGIGIAVELGKTLSADLQPHGVSRQERDRDM